jgi:hypothetical protein
MRHIAVNYLAEGIQMEDLFRVKVYFVLDFLLSHPKLVVHIFQQ